MKDKRKKLMAVYEITTGLLAFFAVALAILDITSGLNQWQYIVDSIIYFIFVCDYIIRLILSTNKRTFVKRQIFDLIAIIPFSSFFRTFRFVRFTRLVKIAKFSKLLALIIRCINKSKVFLNTNGFKYVLFLSCSLIIAGGIGIHFAENMKLSDGFWWAFVTATTVGYGDLSPSSEIGRSIAVVLMITGIGLLGTLTSTITSFFINIKEKKTVPMDNVLSFVMKQIENIDEMENDDIDRICAILQTYKKE